LIKHNNFQPTTVPPPPAAEPAFRFYVPKKNGVNVEAGFVLPAFFLLPISLYNRFCSATVHNHGKRIHANHRGAERKRFTLSAFSSIPKIRSCYGLSVTMLALAPDLC
jgi:hypothetical protein